MRAPTVGCQRDRLPRRSKPAIQRHLLRQLKKLSLRTVGRRDDSHLKTGVGHAPVSGLEYLVRVLMEGEFIKHDVTGIATRRVRVCRQGNDPRAIGKLDLVLFLLGYLKDWPDLAAKAWCS